MGQAKKISELLEHLSTNPFVEIHVYRTDYDEVSIFIGDNIYESFESFTEASEELTELLSTLDNDHEEALENMQLEESDLAYKLNKND